MTDCETMMRSIEAVHGGQVQLIGTPAGISATGGLSWVLTFITPVVPGGENAEPILLISRWPCPVHTDFWSCLFEGLYQLDLKISRSYEQAKITE